MSVSSFLRRLTTWNCSHVHVVAVAVAVAVAVVVVALTNRLTQRHTVSVFSFLRRLTAWHCQHVLLHAGHAEINRYLIST